MCNTLPKRRLGLVAWGWFVAMGVACRPLPEPPGPSSSAPLVSAEVPRPAPAPPSLPPVAMEGSTCRELEPLGVAAMERLLGSPAGAKVAAGHCAVGDRLELGVQLEPGVRYVVDLVTLPPTGETDVALEVHPAVQSRPLLETTVAATEGELRSLSFPDRGIVSPRQVAVQARLVVVVQREAGLIAVRLRSVATVPARR